MRDPDRFRLLYGPYLPPRCRVGHLLTCRVRGRVRVKRISDAPIPWPATTRRGGPPSLTVCGWLVRAVRRESELAVAHWWGVSPQTVWQWRKALGVGATTEGTSRLRGRWAPETVQSAEARERMLAAAGAADRRAKIAAARKGTPRPPHVIEAMRRGRTGKPHSAETRRRMSESHRRRGTRPPAVGRPWSAAEDALLGTMPDATVARLTGRTIMAVACRRQGLRMLSPPRG